MGLRLYRVVHPRGLGLGLGLESGLGLGLESGLGLPAWPRRRPPHRSRSGTRRPRRRPCLVRGWG
eukprot:scaffold39006_cov30-Phaeocystis_antarctica.AAC.1